MLIGISGYIGSGKTTVAMFIQALTMPQKGRWYHDPIEYVKGYGGRPNLKGGWEIKAYAAKLKQMVSLLTGIPVKDLEKEEVKSSELGEEWWQPAWIQSYPHPHKTTVRELLQHLGTQGVRDQVHPNAWVNALFADYTLRFGCINCERGQETDVPGARCIDPKYCYNSDYPNWIISDCRFPNEAQAIKARGGIVIRVNRPESYKVGVVLPSGPNGEKQGHVIPNPRHSSETSLDQWDFDYVIDNDAGLEELLEQVRTMLLHFKIIT